MALYRGDKPNIHRRLGTAIILTAHGDLPSQVVPTSRTFWGGTIDIRTDFTPYYNPGGVSEEDR